MDMDNIVVRGAQVGDYERILELNKESVHFLSELDRGKLENLISEAEIINVVEVDDCVEGFILALREGKKYDSINYLWFSEKYEKFTYIDRAVISVEMQRKGLGRLLYDSVFNNADTPYITAEIDIKPANPGSLAFHEKFGFKEVGQHRVAGGKKLVSLQSVKRMEKQLKDKSNSSVKS